MRCKPGDFAVVVVGGFRGARSRNIGRVVTVDHIATTEELRRAGFTSPAVLYSTSIWATKGETLKWYRYKTGEAILFYEAPFAPDEYLQPIRPAPEQITRDEEIAA